MVVVQWFMPRWLVWIDWRWPFVHRRRGREVLKIRAHGENYGMGPRKQRDAWR